jgi:hypothetical protein
MTTLSLKSHTRPGTVAAAAHALGAWLSKLWAGLEAHFEARSRIVEIRRLQALSDAELARLGIARDRIVHHVFRDKLGL